MKKLRTLFLLACCAVLIRPLRAKYFEARSAEKAQEIIAQAKMALLLLYTDDAEIRKNPCMRQKTYELLLMFKALSNDPRFRQADIQFIKLNVSKHAAQPLLNAFSVEQLPAFILFDGGMPVGTQHPAILYGFAARKQLEEFVDMNLYSAIEEAIQERQQSRQWRLEEAKVRSYEYPYCYYYPYFGVYPWYGCGYGGYGGCGAGRGCIGFGGGVSFCR